MQFNAYLSAIERDLPRTTDKAAAMTFYSKLDPQLRRQFQKADISIPETRAKCVAVAQRVWEGLQTPKKPGDYQSRESQRRERSPRNDKDKRERKYPRVGSYRDHKN